MEDNSTFFDIALYIGYFLVAVAVIAALVLPLIKAAGNPRSLLTMGAGILGLVVIFGIGYALAGNEVLPFYARYEIESTGSKLIGGSLITMYLLLVLALLGIAVTEVSKLFK
jgi:membrane protease YdiL (CAAX protease family)